MTHHIKTLSLAAIASLALACAASAQTTIIDNTTLNGGFESGTSTTPDTWTFAAPATQAARNGGAPADGAWSGVMGDDGAAIPVINGLLQNTGFNVSSGDTFDLTFDWWAASRWIAANKINYRLFTTSDDTIGGTATVIGSGFVTGFAQDTGTTLNGSFSGGTVVGASVGQDLWIEFIGDSANDASSGDGSGFARVDNVVLTAVPEPSAYALLAGLFGLTWVMLRRR